MNKSLPLDLNEAEERLFKSLAENLTDSKSRLLSACLKFENIGINSIVYRLSEKLIKIGINVYLLWPDTGAAALGRRDYQTLSKNIYSYNEFSKSINELDSKYLLLAISPQPFDFDEFKKICMDYTGSIFMINGKLEDTAVGIGTVGRERRRDFIYSWNTVFWLQPLPKGALLKEKANSWDLFRLDPDGYRFSQNFESKPDEETIVDHLGRV